MDEWGGDELGAGSQRVGEGSEHRDPGERGMRLEMPAVRQLPGKQSLVIARVVAVKPLYVIASLRQII